MLTRDLFDSGSYADLLGGTADQPAWAMEAIEQSMRGTLSERPAGEAVWLFAYGSLMWNPVIDAEEQQLATLGGWHRSFCLRLSAGRATPSVPGRMLALREGEECRGLAFRLAEDTLLDELRLVWIREMVHGLYRPIWAQARLADGRRVSAIAFVAETRHAQYRATDELNTVAADVATASGPLGSNREYLTRLEDALGRWGIHAPHVSDLVQRVKEIDVQPANCINGPAWAGCRKA